MFIHLHVFTYTVYDMLYQLSQVYTGCNIPPKNTSLLKVFQKSPSPQFLDAARCAVGHQVVAYDAKQMQHGDAKGICLATDGAQIV